MVLEWGLNYNDMFSCCHGKKKETAITGKNAATWFNLLCADPNKVCIKVRNIGINELRYCSSGTELLEASDTYIRDLFAIQKKAMV